MIQEYIKKIGDRLLFTEKVACPQFFKTGQSPFLGVEIYLIIFIE
jgi:hypothetical protein